MPRASPDMREELLGAPVGAGWSEPSQSGSSALDDFARVTSRGGGESRARAKKALAVLAGALCTCLLIAVLPAADVKSEGGVSEREAGFGSTEVARCGNGRIDQESETCDDGNTRSGDGCDSACHLELPRGDGCEQIDAGEWAAWANLTVPKMAWSGSIVGKAGDSGSGVAQAVLCKPAGGTGRRRAEWRAPEEPPHLRPP